jgi:hypothetical protein
MVHLIEEPLPAQQRPMGMDSFSSRSRASGAGVEGSASKATMPMENPISLPRRREPWNKGRLIGQKRP